MARPDLTCTIEAYDGEGDPIADGQSVSMLRGQEARLVFTASNDSPVRSGPFWLRPSARVNGEREYDPEVEMIDLQPGENHSYTFVRPVSHREEHWEALMLVDIGDFVDESDEHNNQARVCFTVEAHRH